MALALPLLQLICVLLVAPGLVGFIRFLKARFQNRKGPSPFLPYASLLNLLKKEMTIPDTSSWVFQLVPFVVLGAGILLAVLVPTFSVSGLVYGNIFFVSAVLVFSSIFLVFGGMDTGSTFGNMGASREMTLTALVEPALITTLVTLGFVAGQWNLDAIMHYFVVSPWFSGAPYLMISFAGLLFVVLAENARYPVDNPATHLELTMVHEAMLLEYSGPHLAMLEYASALKMAVLMLFLVNVIFPFGIVATVSVISIGIGLGALFLKLAFAGFIIASIETITAKMRFYRMQEYLSIAYLTSMAGFVAVLMFQYF